MDASRAKRMKLTPPDMDPKANPYLAHHYEEPVSNGYSNGYQSNGNSSSGKGTLGKFQRHAATSAGCKVAEDGPQNPFNSKSLSSEYFNILKVRRNLPVHAQRYVPSDTSRIL